MLNPYVGVTGVTSVAEVMMLNEAFGKVDLGNHVPMIGVLVASKSLNGQTMDNSRYPRIERVRSLLDACDPRTFRTVHYTAHEPESLASQVSDLLGCAGPCQGVQMNVVFPPICEVEKIKRHSPNTALVFQANNGVLKSGSPDEVAKRIGEYERFVDYVLIDASGGRGQMLDVRKSVELWRAIREESPILKVGFAGGFDGDSVYSSCRDIVNLVGTFAFSIDAEGGLRDKLSEKWGNDVMNPVKARHYISQAGRLFSHYNN